MGCGHLRLGIVSYQLTKVDSSCKPNCVSYWVKLTTANGIGPYLRTLISSHHDTLAVSVK